jgi:hypothetical protein
MRATHTDPRLLLFALTAAFVFALLAAGLHDLSGLDLFTSGGAPAAEPEPSAAQPAGPPAWVEDPMASPLEELRAP